MKKYLFLAFAFILIFLPQKAECPAYAEENLDEIVDKTLDNTDLSGYEQLIALLNEYSGFSFTKTAKEIIEEILNGDAEPAFSYFADAGVRLLSGEIGGLLPQMLVILIIAFLYGILKNLNSGFINAATDKVIYVVCYSLIVTVIAYMFVDTVKYAMSVFVFIKKFSDVCFPVLLTLITAIGASASVAVYQPYVLIFSNLLMGIVTNVIMPLFYITFVFGIVGNLSDNLKLDKFSAVAKSASEWILGIVFGTFITLMTAQGITGAGVDGLAMKGAKYALSSYVPIIGNYIKDGFDIIAAGCMVIKNAAGLCALLILLIGILVPIIKITLLSLILKLTAAIAEPLSDGKMAAVINVAGDSLKILIVAIVCTGISMIVAVMLIIYTCNPGVL